MMRGGRAPDTSLYKPRSISAPKARTPASTATSAANSASTSSSSNATTTSRSSATTTASSRTAPVTASSRSVHATTVSRIVAPTASARATTRPVVGSTSRFPVATATSSRLARTAPSTAGVPTKPATRSSTSTTGATRSNSSSATSSASRSKAATVSKRVQQYVASNQDDREDLDSGYPECMEIESLDDYSPSATESAFSILSGAGELNIITAVRLRPMSTTEKQKGYRRVVDMVASEGNWVRIVNPVALVPSTQSSSSSSLRPGSQRTMVVAASESVPSSFPPQFTQEFHFDHTFWSFDRAETRKVASQSSIYDELGLFTIENALQGYNCSIFAYGQTSAGKTYTMMGNESSAAVGASTGTPQSTDKGDPGTRRGLIPRICRGLFDRLTHEAPSSFSDFSIHVSYIEIYHEHAYDLLAQASANNSLTGKESLKVRESPETGVYVEHANQVRVAGFEDIKKLIDEGNHVRSVAATNANLRSSRSHAILTLYLKQTTSPTSGASLCESKKSKICLVDLAGSERADISGANGIRLREAGSINRSLATLADVISALSKRAAVSAQLHHQSHNSGQQQPQEHFVPYRNSILTRLLKESLGGNAKTIMLAAISPCCAHYEESLSTLKYIERAKSVVNVARVNAESSLDMVDALRKEILELKAQLLQSSASVSNSVSPCPSFSSVLSVMNCPLALQLDEDDEKEDLGADNTDREPISANPEGASLALDMITEAIAAAESPLYAASLCFDEKEKSRLEREVAKLKVQMRKKEREFQMHEYATKALNDKVSAQVLRQQAHVFNLVGIHKKYLGLMKLRVLDRWRYNAHSISTVGAMSSKATDVLLPGIDTNVMTDSENNNCESVDSRTIVQQRADMKSPVNDHNDEEEDPACSVDDEDEAVVSVLKPELKKISSHSVNEKGSGVAPLFGLLESKQKAFFGGIGGQQQLHHVDVLCSSIITDFFGDTSTALPLLPSIQKASATSLTNSKSVSKSIKGIKSSDNNQLDPSDDTAHETDGDDGDDERISASELLIDEIIDHEAESNQVHNSNYQQPNSDIGSTIIKKKIGVLAGLSEGEDPSQVDQNDDDFDDEDDEEDFDDEEEEEDYEEGTDSSSKPLSLASQRQRAQSKLARCLDAVDIARKAMGPTVRKLKQIADKSSLLHPLSDNADGFQVGTGMERQLLTQIDKSLVVVNQHVTELGDVVVSTSQYPLDVSLYTKFEGLLSDFCLQTMGLVCDQLTLGAGGTSAIARDQMNKQLDGFQIEVKELVNMAICSGFESGNAALLVSSLMELFGLSERMKFAWYAIDQKNLQRLAQFRSQQQQQILTMATSISPSETTTENNAKAAELLAQYDALVVHFEAQTAEFARREEEDRLALLLNTNQLDQEHEQRVAELESELETAHASIAELEERLLAHVSKVELLEQELELTAVVRTTNELLLKHHSSSDEYIEEAGHYNALVHSGLSSLSSSSPSSSSVQCSNIIVKLEEELASALTQINELETNQGTGASVNHSQANPSFSSGAEGRSSIESSSALHDACATLADREMLEYMERTREIEKQNNEAISKLNAVMIERRHSHLGISSMPITTGPLMDHAAHQVKETGTSGNEIVSTTSQVERIKQELQSALARADILEDQYLKLMVSFENQTDTVLHLEEELYDAQVHGKQAEDTIAGLHERVGVLETELSAAQKLTTSLKEDLKDVMSELCVTECKCGQLDAKCAELTASCDASKLRIESLEMELQAAKAAAQQAETESAILVPESEFVAAEAQCRALEAESALLETRCKELESANALMTTESEELLGAKKSALVDLQNGLAQMTSDKLDLEEQYKALVEQQEREASRICSLQEQLEVAQAREQELEERLKRSEYALRDHESLREELRTVNESNASLTEEVAELQRELCSVQTQVTELEARSATERTESTESQTLLIRQLQGELAESTQQVDSLLAQQRDNEAQMLRVAGDLETANERSLSLESQYSESQRVCEELKMNSEATEARCAELESSVKVLGERNQRFESQVSELQQQMVEERAQKAELEGHLDELTSSNSDLQSQVASARTENVELQVEIAGLRARQGELQEECDNASYECESLREELEAAHKSNDRLTGEMAKLKSELSSVQAQMTDLETKLAAEPSESATAQALLIQRLEAELAASAQQVDDLVAQQHDAQEQIQRAASDLETEFERSASLEMQYLDLQRVYDELKTYSEATEAHCAELESGMKVLEESTNSVEVQFVALQQQTAEENAQKAELEQQLTELTTTNAELQTQLASARAEKTEFRVKNTELKAQLLEFQEKCRFLRELTATQKTKVTALTHELRVAYEQYDKLALSNHHESTLAQSTKVLDLENQIQAISSQLQAVEAEKVAPHAANAALLARIQELEQSCELKSSAILASEIEHKEAVASSTSLKNDISNLEEQLASVKQERELLITEKPDLNQRIAALELDLQAASEQIRELESLKFQKAAFEASESESTSLNEKMELLQTECDATKHQLARLQAEYEDLERSKDQILSELQADLATAQSRTECLETQVVALNAQLRTAEESLELSHDEHVALVSAHEAQLETQRVQLAQLAEEKCEVICKEAMIAALNAERASLSLTIQNLEKELANAQLQARKLEETLDSQTLLLAEVEKSLTVAVARVKALESQFQEAKSTHNCQLEALREELMADAEAHLTLLRHEMEERAGADEAEANATRILELERQLSEKSLELDKVSDEYELQLSMTTQHHDQELQEALGLAEHWVEQHQAKTIEFQALQSDFEVKIDLLNAEISNHEATAQNLQVYLERTQSSHYAELKQWETKYNNTVTQLHLEIEQTQAVCRDWELKYQDLEACVSPDTVCKVRAQIEAAKAHADECEVTYRVELENKLQLEFDLASVCKELHVTKQQLTELQCRELELDTKDPLGAARRSQARQNELAELERERLALAEKNAQVAKREASVKLLEASAHARLEDLKQQHQNQMQQQEKRVREKFEDSWKDEQAQLLARIGQLEARVTVLSQQLDESNCRSEMQGEELHSFRSWRALQELLSEATSTSTTENGAFGYGEGDEDDRMPGSSKNKKLSPEARRLVLKHLNSLDTWFERAILGKMSSDAGRTERRVSLLAVLEGSEQGFTDLLASREDNQKEEDDAEEDDDDDDGLIDASDVDAVPVEFDDLGDELLAMCSDAQNQNEEGEEGLAMEPNYDDDLDAIFDRDAALKYAQAGDGSANKQHGKSSQQRLGELGGKSKTQAGGAVPLREFPSSSSSPSSYDKCLLYGSAAGGAGLDPKDEVAQLRLTVLKLKQVLDAKEETILFLDDKMKYYEELLRHAEEEIAPATTAITTATMY